MALDGWIEKRTAPPPKKGSQYEVILLGSNGVMSPKSCRFPPTHLTTGATSLFFAIITPPYYRSSHYDYNRPLPTIQSLSYTKFVVQYNSISLHPKL